MECAHVFGSFCSNLNDFTLHRLNEAFYVSPPTKDQLPKVYVQQAFYDVLCFSDIKSQLLTLKHLQHCPEGSVLFGDITYGKPSFGGQGNGNGSQKNPASYQISYVVPPNKVDSVIY